MTTTPTPTPKPTPTSTSKTWQRDPRSWGVITETGSPVADVWQRDAIDLIVAAPDLLAATDALLRFIDEHQFHQSGDDVMFPWPPLRDLTEKTREAIAKARGQG